MREPERPTREEQEVAARQMKIGLDGASRGGPRTFVTPSGGTITVQLLTFAEQVRQAQSLEREVDYLERLADGRLRQGPVTPARRTAESAPVVIQGPILPLHRAAAEPRAAEPRKEIPVVKDKNAVWAEIEQASKTFAGDTEAQRVSAYILAHPDMHRKYDEAPWPSSPVDVAPQPITLSEAQRALTANPRSPDAIDRYFAARGRERAAASGGKLTQAQGYVEVLMENPDLYRVYESGLRAGLK